MLLSTEDVELFFKLHRSLMHFVNQRLNIVPNISFPEEFAALPPETALEVRNALLDEVDLIESFVDENPAGLTDDEIDIVLSWRHQVSGEFFAFRQLKKYMVFLSTSEPATAYGVVALSEPLENLIGPYLPVMVRAGLLPFKDKIVYDGLLSSYSISFGGGIKRMLNDSYRNAKDRLGIVTSLPIESTPVAKEDLTKKTTSLQKSTKKKSSSAKDVKPILEAIVGMTDEFCRLRLNDEYATLCQKLAEKLSRKRPSPLLRGRPQTWASGIIRTVGWVNFLDDPASQPHMPLTDIDQAIGVSQSSGQGKSSEIRKMLKLQRFDPQWTLPSRMDDNPLVWMLEVNGFMMDIRDAPRDAQQVAFEKGLIPYIPADRDATSTASKSKTVDEALPASDQLYQFKITLNDSNPRIWRRIQVRDCTLDKLHEHIQSAMGWTNSHLHQFEIEGRRYGDPELLDDGFMDFDCEDSTVRNLSDIMPRDGKRFRFLYEYDFGDGWEHEVVLEGCPAAEPGKRYPLCVEGERACPPEDVGGVWGYQEYLEAVSNPEHEQHDELLEWSGPFDPEAFDAAESTQLMHQGLPDWRAWT